MNRVTCGMMVLGLGLIAGPSAVTASMTLEIEAVVASGLVEGGYGPGGKQNYNVGYTYPPGSSSAVQRRNFFIFELPDPGLAVTSAKLKLYLPGPPDTPLGYISPDPHEMYRISGTPFSATAFFAAFMTGGDPPTAIPALAAMYETLGAMPSYGSVLVDPGMGGGDVILDFTPEGIAALSAALGSSIVLGGRLTDITPDMPGIPPAEWIFLYTDVGHVTSSGFVIPMPRLELTLVPEPASLSLLALMAGCCHARPRKIRR